MQPWYADANLLRSDGLGGSKHSADSRLLPNPAMALAHSTSNLFDARVLEPRQGLGIRRIRRIRLGSLPVKNRHKLLTGYHLVGARDGKNWNGPNIKGTNFLGSFPHSLVTHQQVIADSMTTKGDRTGDKSQIMDNDCWLLATEQWSLGRPKVQFKGPLPGNLTFGFSLNQPNKWYPQTKQMGAKDLDGQCAEIPGSNAMSMT